MSDNVITTVRQTLKTAFYNDVQVQLDLAGDDCKVVGCLIKQRYGRDLMTGGEVKRLHSLGDGVKTLVGIHRAIEVIFKELERKGIEVDYHGVEGGDVFDTEAERDASLKKVTGFIGKLQKRKD